MNRDNLFTSLTLILIGLIFLLANVGVLPKRALFSYWPILIILLGIYLIYKYKGKSFEVSLFSEESSEWNLQIGDYQIEEPLLRLIVGVLVFVCIIGLTTLILFGALTPILIVVLILAGLGLILGLGIPLLALAIPAAILGLPILVIIWLFSLIF